MEAVIVGDSFIEHLKSWMTINSITLNFRDPAFKTVHFAGQSGATSRTLAVRSLELPPNPVLAIVIVRGNDYQSELEISPEDVARRVKVLCTNLKQERPSIKAVYILQIIPRYEDQRPIDRRRRWSMTVAQARRFQDWASQVNIALDRLPQTDDCKLKFWRCGFLMGRRNGNARPSVDVDGVHLNSRGQRNLFMVVKRILDHYKKYM